MSLLLPFKLCTIMGMAQVIDAFWYQQSLTRHSICTSFESVLVYSNQCGLGKHIQWWRHQMETFSALLALCVGKSSFTGEFPAQRPVTRSFDVFFGLRLNKKLDKQSWGWWFETQSSSLWRHCNDMGHMARVGVHTTWYTSVRQKPWTG